MELLFVTGNEGKARELQAALQRPIHQISIDIPEVQALDVKEVIEHKAREAYRRVGQPILVEDTSLALMAWHGLPGALIRWFLQSVGPTGICRMLRDFENRAAIAEVAFGYCDGERFVAFSGSVEGTIPREPRGTLGFGWDPIFAPGDSDKTFAEMTDEDKKAVSMRTQAALKLKQFLDAHGL